MCLIWICDSDEKFEKHSREHENYLIVRDYKKGKVKKQFSGIKKSYWRRGKLKLHKTTFSPSSNLIIQYKPFFPNLKNTFRNHLIIL